MNTPIQRGSGLANVSETWDQNERNRPADHNPQQDATGDAAPAANDLEQAIREEASEYDNANKEDRVLGGNRATVSDDDAGNA